MAQLTNPTSAFPITPETTEFGRVAPRWHALSAVAVAYFFNAADRQLLAILQEPIGRDLQLNDTMMGTLSLSFAIAYAAASFPLAALSDSGWMRRVIVCTLAAWSVLTVACGAATSFLALALARAGVAIGEAGCTPAAHALIAQVYEANRRARPLALVTAMAVIGTATAFAVGGWVGQMWDWRIAFFVLGGAGLVVTPLVWLGVRHHTVNVRRSSQSAAPRRAMEVASMFWRMRSLRYLAIAAGLNSVAGYGFSQWMGSFLIRSHGLSLAEAGIALSVVAGASGIVGVLAAGVVTDQLAARNDRAYAIVPAAMLAIAVPAAIGLAAAASVPLALLAYGTCNFVGLSITAPVFAYVQRLTPTSTRATAAAFIILVMNLAGLGLGPPLFGVVSDVLTSFGRDDSLRGAFLAGASCLLLACLFATLAIRWVIDDVRRSIEIEFRTDPRRTR